MLLWASFMSLTKLDSLAGFLNMYAGWKVGITFALEYLKILPRSCEIFICDDRSAWVATAPRAQMALGQIIFNWLSRRSFWQGELGSGCGSLLFVGRYFTTFVIKTSFRSIPINDKVFSKSFPDLPTNGLPCICSSRPGASPISSSFAFALPSPKIIF